MDVTSAKGMESAPPNSSIPIRVQANGVLVAPANTATKPRAAYVSNGNEKS